MSILLKHPDATLDYGFDYSNWLDSGETISDSSWEVPSGLVEEGSNFSATGTKIWLSGGTEDEEYTITNTIETTESATVEVRSFTLLVAVFRVTVEDVQAIIQVPTTLELVPFIRVANLLVSKVFANVTTLSDAQKKEVERYLAAHFIAMTRVRQKRTEALGDANVTYAGNMSMVTGATLANTTYGQLALLADTSGTLARVGKKRIVFEAIPVMLDT